MRAPPRCGCSKPHLAPFLLSHLETVAWLPAQKSPGNTGGGLSSSSKCHPIPYSFPEAGPAGNIVLVKVQNSEDLKWAPGLR